MAEEKKSTQDASYEERIDNSYDQFVDSVGDTTATLKDMKNKLKDQKQKTEEANAEVQAVKATQQGVISVSDALKLIDDEQLAKQQYHEAASKYMTSSATAFGQTLVSGTQVLTSMVDDGLEGVFGGLGDSSGALKTFGLGTAAMIGASFLLPGGELQEMAKTAISGYMQTQNENEIDPDVEPKYIDGQETTEGYANSIYEDTVPTGQDYDSGATGEEAMAEKEIASDEKYVAPTENEATSISEGEIDEMASLDTYLGKMTDMLENSESEVGQTLAKGISVLEASEFGQLVETGLEKVMEGKVGQLFAMRDQMDKEDAPDKENEGLDGPG